MSVSYQTYFVTKCVEHRHTILASPTAAETVIQSLAHARHQEQIKLLAFVIMPDHYHAVFTLLPGETLSRLMMRIGSFTANRIRRDLDMESAIWQKDGFYDRACRTDAEVIAAVEYVHDNPVRKGLVKSPEEWLFSSAHPTWSSLLDWEWWV
ncbi:MAG: REP-associated tyrosine transposase [Isosphaeraceae bacterium]